MFVEILQFNMLANDAMCIAFKGEESGGGRDKLTMGEVGLFGTSISM